MPLSNISNLHPKDLSSPWHSRNGSHAHMTISAFLPHYLSALFRNFSDLFIVRIDSNLREPIYFFLRMLSVTDLILSTIVMPKIISNFWVHDREVHLEDCLVQVSLIHSLCTMASGFILFMALDHYVALSNPLRHFTTLTNSVIWNLGIVFVFSAVLLFSPQPFMLPYHKANTIPHTYCEFMALIKSACADTRIFRLYSLTTAALLTGGLDFILIICSNIVIIYTVFHFPSKATQMKTLGTCGLHICMILVAYIPVVFSFLTHRFGHNGAPHIYIIVADIYLLVLSLANPMISGIRTMTISEHFLQILTSKNA